MRYYSNSKLLTSIHFQLTRNAFFNAAEGRSLGGKVAPVYTVCTAFTNTVVLKSLDCNVLNY